MEAELLHELPEKILSQCGLVSALLMAAVVWLAVQLARTRAAWEDVMKIVAVQNTTHENVARSRAKLKGIVSAIRR